MERLRGYAILGMIGVMTGLGVLAEGCNPAPTHSVTAFRKRLTIWVGKDINALISAWGPPTEIYPLPNGKSKLYIWEESGGNLVRYDSQQNESASVGGNRYAGLYGRGSAESGTAVAKSLTCKRLMTVSDSGVVMSTSLDGNNCVAPVE